MTAVIAHRGSSHDFPEHSLEAYLDAIAVGADGLECDVRLTSDGELICLHDATLQRTSNGRGPASVRSYAELTAFDCGVPSGGPLLLRELFELVRSTGRRVEIAVETKHPNKYGGAVEEALASILREFDWLGDDSPVRVMSFSAAALCRMQTLAPDLNLVYLLEHQRVGAGASRLPGGATICGVDIELVRSAPDWVASLINHGHELHVWTVDTTEEMDLSLAAGATGLITNRPVLALQHLGREPGIKLEFP